MRSKQSSLRTVAKSMSWQAVGLVTTTGTAFLLTGSLAVGGAMAVSSAAIGAVLFVLHEKVWDRVRWGCTKDARDV